MKLCLTVRDTTQADVISLLG